MKHPHTLSDTRIPVGTRTLEAAQVSENGITLSGAATHAFAALFLGPETSLAGSPVAHLDCALADGPMGSFVKVGAMAQTSVPGVFVAGDIARAMPNINFALADGAQAGSVCHASLLFPNFVPQLETTA